jgi:hypothetical protein
MEPGLGDFLSQIPIIFLLLPLFFGGLYIILMVYIFRRAAERRRRAREAQGLPVAPKRPSLEARAVSGTLNAAGAFISNLSSRRNEGSSAAKSPANWTRPPELRSVPEPELDLLVMPIEVLNEVASSEPMTGIHYDTDYNTNYGTNYDANPDDVYTANASSLPIVPPNRAVSRFDSQSRMEPIMDNLNDAVEIMRVWRDLNDGSLIIQMGDQRYRTMGEIRNPDLARRFTAVVRELWNMVGGGATPRQITPLPSTTTAAEISSSMPTTDTQKPSGLRGMVRNALGSQPAAKKNDAPTGSGIAGAAGSPYATRSIHIRPAHDHGIRIEVDGHYYEAIGDVVDPDIREFLFGIMREWEARQ